MSAISFLKNSIKNPTYGYRRLMWKYYETSSEKELRLNTQHGKINFSSKDGYIGRHLYLYKNYHYDWIANAIKFLSKNLKSKDNIMFNIGANIGLNSIPYAKTDLFSKVIAIEPYTKNFDLLKSNIELNELSDKNNAYQMAMSDEIREAYLQVDPQNYGNCEVVFEKKSNEVPIQITTLDSFVESQNIELKKIRFLSIDVQGFEANVLRGAKKVLKEAKPYVILEIDSFFKEKWNDILPIITEHFDSFIPITEIEISTPISINELRNYVDNVPAYLDYIFIPKA